LKRQEAKDSIDVATFDHATDSNQRGLAVVLDLSGNQSRAVEWATAVLGRARIRALDKSELKWSSKRDALQMVRSISPAVFSVFVTDLTFQSGRGAIILFGVLSGARTVILGDSRGRFIRRSRLGGLVIEGPRFVLEALFGYAVVVPLSLALIWLLGLAQAFRGPVRDSRIKSRRLDSGESEASIGALYIRATVSASTEGGMQSHVAGFSSGAIALGHRLVWLFCGSQPSDGKTLMIAPGTLTATRAIFETWNNLVFSFKSRSMINNGTIDTDKLDLLYQRYSRFNWTGVLLSALTGLPLFLEYNGSEVWLSRQWDPVGLKWLLKLVEHLNLRAADRIFVVSSVERQNLIAAGVDPAKVIVNPNGVDPDKFRPDCGGNEIRRNLGIADRIVVGFVGTFGPWHGAPVLARAAGLLRPGSNCHFLFIGTGEQLPQTESIIGSTNTSATFTGNIPHTEMPAYLDACDILVSPHVPLADGSEYFGSPTKLFEYLAMEKAIVASNLGQVGNVINHNENGFLVEAGDPADLAAAIQKLSTDSELRSRLGVAARATAIQHFTWRRNAGRVFDALKTISSN
jgi:glycosyltransferase involved in cell wall biosynthesis